MRSRGLRIGSRMSADARVWRLARARRRGHLMRSRRGSEVLELALLFLPLLWLTFGAVDFGYYFYLQHNCQAAAHAGARAGIIATATNADVQAAVDAVMS